MTDEFKIDPLKVTHDRLVKIEEALLGADIDLSAALIRVRHLMDLIRPVILEEEVSA